MALDKEKLLPIASFSRDLECQYIIHPIKFLFLNALSYGFYSVWWIYKVWKFLIQRQNSNANPALRTLFEIVYFIPRCYQILKLAKEKGYTRTYVPVLLFFPYFFFLLCSMTPPPLFFLWPLSGIFLLQPLMAFNYFLSKSPELDVVVDRTFSVAEIVIAILGSIFWLLVIVGMVAMILSKQESDFQL